MKVVFVRTYQGLLDYIPLHTRNFWSLLAYDLAMDLAHVAPMDMSTVYIRIFHVSNLTVLAGIVLPYLSAALWRFLANAEGLRCG